MSWAVTKSTLRLDGLLGLIGFRKAVILMVVFIMVERFILKSKEKVRGVKSITQQPCLPAKGAPPGLSSQGFCWGPSLACNVLKGEYFQGSELNS